MIRESSFIDACSEYFSRCCENVSTLIHIFSSVSSFLSAPGSSARAKKLSTIFLLFLLGFQKVISPDENCCVVCIIRERERHDRRRSVTATQNFFRPHTNHFSKISHREGGEKRVEFCGSPTIDSRLVDYQLFARNMTQSIRNFINSPTKRFQFSIEFVDQVTTSSGRYRWIRIYIVPNK